MSYWLHIGIPAPICWGECEIRCWDSLGAMGSKSDPPKIWIPGVINPICVPLSNFPKTVSPMELGNLMDEISASLVFLARQGHTVLGWLSSSGARNPLYSCQTCGDLCCSSPLRLMKPHTCSLLCETQSFRGTGGLIEVLLYSENFLASQKLFA